MLTYRLRVPVRMRRPRLRGGFRVAPRRSGGRRRYRRGPMRGGILPALVPIIAAAIGAIPGIASVAMSARRRN